jgi:hypothetical protein
MASNNGDSSASCIRVLSSQPAVQNSLTIDFLPCLYHLDTDHMSSNFCVIKNMLPSNGSIRHSNYVAYLTTLSVSRIFSFGEDTCRMSSKWCNENVYGERKCSEKACPNAPSFTINSTWLDLGLKPGCRLGERPKTECLSDGATVEMYKWILLTYCMLRYYGLDSSITWWPFWIWRWIFGFRRKEVIFFIIYIIT